MSADRSSLIPALQTIAARLRVESVRATSEAGSGHPSSCMSCADIVSALFFHEMRWDPTDAAANDVDVFVLSKGHAAPILWAALSEARVLLRMVRASVPADVPRVWLLLVLVRRRRSRRTY